jgi:hypothetical protein
LFVDAGGDGADGKAFVKSLVGSTGVGGVILGGEGSLAESDTECWTGFLSGTELEATLGVLASSRTFGEDWVCR